jgi:hypothetical protein
VLSFRKVFIFGNLIGGAARRYSLETTITYYLPMAHYLRPMTCDLRLTIISYYCTSYYPTIPIPTLTKYSLLRLPMTYYLRSTTYSILLQLWLLYLLVLPVVLLLRLRLLP